MQTAPRYIILANKGRVVNLTFAPLWYHMTGGWEDPKARLHAVAWENFLLILPEIEPRSSSLYPVIIQAELSRVALSGPS
jgi:hypothetical protein